MKNNKNKGFLQITLSKTGKNKIFIAEYFSPMRVPNYKNIKTQVNTDKYYWEILRPQINKLVKNSILNKEFLKYNGSKLLYREFTDPTNNETLINIYEMNWEVYYYNKTSSIEILKRYTKLNENEPHYIVFPVQDIRIDKFNSGKLRITKFYYFNSKFRPLDGGGNSQNYNKYVKTNLSPKQYYLQVYKNKLETEKLTNNSYFHQHPIKRFAVYG